MTNPANTVDVLQTALDDISREGGWTCHSYEDIMGARCMLGAISYAEHRIELSLSRKSEAWLYVMKATKRLLPLKWQLKILFSSSEENIWPEHMVMRITGGRWTARRIMKKALKMAKKDAKVEADKKVTEEAERVAHSAAKVKSAVDQHEYAA